LLFINITFFSCFAPPSCTFSMILDYTFPLDIQASKIILCFGIILCDISSSIIHISKINLGFCITFLSRFAQQSLCFAIILGYTLSFILDALMFAPSFVSLNLIRTLRLNFFKKDVLVDWNQ
jgi:hypothetical protein